MNKPRSINVVKRKKQKKNKERSDRLDKRTGHGYTSEKVANDGTRKNREFSYGHKGDIKRDQLAHRSVTSYMKNDQGNRGYKGYTQDEYKTAVDATNRHLRRHPEAHKESTIWETKFI